MFVFWREKAAYKCLRHLFLIYLRGQITKGTEAEIIGGRMKAATATRYHPGCSVVVWKRSSGRKVW